MPLPTNNRSRSPLTNDDIIHALNMQTDALSPSIKHELTQRRFTAIDHASIIDKHNHWNNFVQWGVLGVSSLLVITMLTSHYLGFTSEVTSSEEPKGNEVEQQEDRLPVDQQQDFEIYDWLYNNYG